MTTTKESPDSGAGAESPDVRFALAALTHCIEHGRRITTAEAMLIRKVINTRAQDSGQGEAVALYREIDNAARHVSNATGDVETGKDAGALSFLREAAHHLRNALAMMERAGPHPPKPAQDAAGKGVEDILISRMALAITTHMGDCADCRNVLDALDKYRAAKPAQVGERKGWCADCGEKVGETDIVCSYCGTLLQSPA